MLPGPKAYGPVGQAFSAGMPTLRRFSSAAPIVTSHEPVFRTPPAQRTDKSHWPAPAYHQPKIRSALGGRSPATSVLLAPSAMSISATREFQYSTPSLLRRLRPL